MFFHMVFRDGLTTEQKSPAAPPKPNDWLENPSSIDDLPMLIPIYKGFPMDIRSQNAQRETSLDYCLNPNRHCWALASVVATFGYRVAGLMLPYLSTNWDKSAFSISSYQLRHDYHFCCWKSGVFLPYIFSGWPAKGMLRIYSKIFVSVGYIFPLDYNLCCFKPSCFHIRHLSVKKKNWFAIWGVQWGYPIKCFAYNGTSYESPMDMDDLWGDPYFSKPPYEKCWFNHGKSMKNRVLLRKPVIFHPRNPPRTATRRLLKGRRPVWILTWGVFGHESWQGDSCIHKYIYIYISMCVWVFVYMHGFIYKYNIYIYTYVCVCKIHLRTYSMYI